MIRTSLTTMVSVLGFAALATALIEPLHIQLDNRETERHIKDWRDMQKALPVIDSYVRFLARHDSLHMLARSREGVAKGIRLAGLDGAHVVEAAPAFKLVMHVVGDVTLSLIGGSVVHTWYADELFEEWESMAD